MGNVLSLDFFSLRFLRFTILEVLLLIFLNHRLFDWVLSGLFLNFKSLKNLPYGQKSKIIAIIIKLSDFLNHELQPQFGAQVKLSSLIKHIKVFVEFLKFVIEVFIYQIKQLLIVQTVWADKLLIDFLERTPMLLQQFRHLLVLISINTTSINWVALLDI